MYFDGVPRDPTVSSDRILLSDRFLQHGDRWLERISKQAFVRNDATCGGLLRKLMESIDSHCTGEPDGNAKAQPSRSCTIPMT